MLLAEKRLTLILYFFSVWCCESQKLASTAYSDTSYRSRKRRPLRAGPPGLRRRRGHNNTFLPTTHQHNHPAPLSLSPPAHLLLPAPSVPTLPSLVLPSVLSLSPLAKQAGVIQSSPNKSMHFFVPHTVAILLFSREQVDVRDTQIDTQTQTNVKLKQQPKRQIEDRN